MSRITTSPQSRPPRARKKSVGVKPIRLPSVEAGPAAENWMGENPAVESLATQPVSEPKIPEEDFTASNLTNETSASGAASDNATASATAAADTSHLDAALDETPENIRVSAADVAALLREASTRAFNARMTTQCVFDHAVALLRELRNPGRLSTHTDEDFYNFEAVAAGAVDLLAALERDLSEAFRMAKYGGIGYLKPYFERGILRGEGDLTSIYWRSCWAQIRALNGVE